MLALSFLVMIGLSLIIEGWDSEKAEELHLKNYIYFGMAFSFGVEMLNIVMRKRMARGKVVQLNEPQIEIMNLMNQTRRTSKFLISLQPQFPLFQLSILFHLMTQHQNGYV